MGQISVANADFRRLVERHPRAIMLTTEEPRIAWVNQAFSRITGYGHEEVVGQSPSMLSAGLFGKDFYKVMWDRLLTTGRWEGLVWNRRKQGELYPEWLTIYEVEGERQPMYAGVFIDVSELSRVEERTTAMAYYDPLTGLPNRALFREFLEARMGQRQEEGKTFAVLFVDIDHFKEVNDVYGHGVGDFLLQRAAHAIEHILRKGDVIARLSGDEFAAIVETATGGAGLAEICQRLVGAFKTPFVIEGKGHFISVSVGSAVFPEDGRSGTELLEKSDKAMYAAKLAGRNCYRSFDPEFSNRARREQQLAEALAEALNQAPEQFRVVYQPQFRLKEKILSGMEALLRWEHPEFGAVPPSVFVPLAESRGLMHTLTQRLIACILADLSTLTRRVPEGIRFAVNISAWHVSDDRLELILHPLFLALDALCWIPELEITETHLMELSPGCLAKLQHFGKQGVRIALDDFGTGYSSLAYLHALPIHVLKIDRQFIDRLGLKRSDDQVVAAVLAIAEALDLEVVAEGIETQAQRSCLIRMACRVGQGYLFARPMPWDEFLLAFLD